MRELVITEKTAGGRLDKAVFRYLDKASSGFVYKMLRKKNIVLNDKKASGNEILKAGDSVKLYLAEETIGRFRSSTPERKEQKDARPEQKIASLIVYEDEHLIAFNKPEGMLSQRSSKADLSLNDLLVSYLGSSDLFTPGISNRLDRNTTGLVLAGKDPAAVRELNRAIRERDLTKLYLCMVKGRIGDDRSVEGYLVKDKDSNTAKISKEQIPGSSYIRTEYHVLSQQTEASLLMVDLITGKSHQIRAHLAGEGHPVIGDPKYGDDPVNEIYRRKYHLRSQLLHAWKVRFGSMQGILSYLNGTEITALLPDAFRTIMKGERLCPLGDQEV